MGELGLESDRGNKARTAATQYEKTFDSLHLEKSMRQGGAALSRLSPSAHFHPRKCRLVWNAK